MGVEAGAAAGAFAGADVGVDGPAWWACCIRLGASCSRELSGAAVVLRVLGGCAGGRRLPGRADLPRSGRARAPEAVPKLPGAALPGPAHRRAGSAACQVCAQGCAAHAEADVMSGHAYAGCRSRRHLLHGRTVGHIPQGLAISGRQQQGHRARHSHPARAAQLCARGTPSCPLLAA